jgi:hypothetical protein
MVSYRTRRPSTLADPHELASCGNHGEFVAHHLLHRTSRKGLVGVGGETLAGEDWIKALSGIQRIKTGEHKEGRR